MLPGCQGLSPRRAGPGRAPHGATPLGVCVVWVERRNIGHQKGERANAPPYDGQKVPELKSVVQRESPRAVRPEESEDVIEDIVLDLCVEAPLPVYRERKPTKLTLSLDMSEEYRQMLNDACSILSTVDLTVTPDMVNQYRQWYALNQSDMDDLLAEQPSKAEILKEVFKQIAKLLVVPDSDGGLDRTLPNEPHGHHSDISHLSMSSFGSPFPKDCSQAAMAHRDRKAQRHLRNKQRATRARAKDLLKRKHKTVRRDR